MADVKNDKQQDGESPQFVHLRVHSAFSLLEGALPIKKIIGKAVADGQPAIGIADTNNLFAALEFSLKCMDDGLQPLIGCQLSIDMEDEAEGDKRGHAQHLAKLPSIVLIAATDAGYVRLMARKHVRLITCFVPLEPDPARCASLEFADPSAYSAYNEHPEHETFVQERWDVEVTTFLEIDTTALSPGSG